MTLMQITLPLDPPIDFVRHSRARRYVVRVRPNGSVRVTIPRWGSRREAEAFAARERAWIDRQLTRVAEERHSAADGLAVNAMRALREQAARELPARLMELAAAHGLAVSAVTVRDQKWRWGSCSPGGRISLNWRLVRMPAWIRDYVIIHELMHLKRMDHSPAFWSLVAAACPEHLAARCWLRDHQSTLA
jgi:hypothetical protein